MRRRRGKCWRCGMCCKSIIIGRSVMDGAEKDKPGSDRYFILNNWQPLTYEQAVEINPFHKRLEGRDDLSFWRCTKLDPSSNLCTIYHRRPHVCRKYPWYKYSVLYLDQLITPECGFAADCAAAAAENPSREIATGAEA
ncbi:MAG: YkgJ family cysteine cluster protein [Patescibacteria group bacterium]